MNWRASQLASRARYLDKYDAAEAANYDAWIGKLSREDEDAYLADLQSIFTFTSDMRVLDVGAGTGTMCTLLSRIPELTLSALEPAPAMLNILKQKTELAAVSAVEGFCDSTNDRAHFAQGQFDVIVSRQLANGLYDPLTAFKNWHYWLADKGVVILIDGFYGRSAWTGKWQEEVDTLPLASNQSLALVPYLLEAAGFKVELVQLMEATNNLKISKTLRYLVIARKIAEPHS